MLTIILSITSFGILIAEFWMGIVVVGWQGDRPYLERSRTPGPYWMMMALHTVACVGVPVLAFMAGL